MTAEQLWNQFCNQNNIDACTEYQAWAFGDAPDQLAALVLAGIKTGTASAYDLYAIDDGEPMPKEGDYSVILNSKDEAVCVIKTTKLYVVPFNKVSAEHAFKEGEGDRSLEYWRQVHKEFFASELKEYGMEFNENIRVLCEEFELL